MLAPHAEVGFEEVELLKFGEHSLRLFPQFVSEVMADSGIDPDFSQCGTQLVGIDRDDAEYLRRLYDFRKELGLEARWTGGIEAREQEPLLAPRVTSGVWLPNDGQVNNRRLLVALKKGFQQLGGELYEETGVTGIDSRAVDNEVIQRPQPALTRRIPSSPDASPSSARGSR
jgi:glycine oxidase